MWEIELRHEGLKKYRLIRGSDKDVVEQKAAAQKAVWDEMWQKKQEKHNALLKSQIAIEHSKQALEVIKTIENILNHTLAVDDKINWESLKDKSAFLEPKPQPPQEIVVPPPPRALDQKYQPILGFWDKISSSKRQEKIDKAKLSFNNDYQAWLKQKEEILKKNADCQAQYPKALERWAADKQDFLNKQKERNDAIENRKKQYLSKVPDAIIDYCDLVLSSSKYPDYFPQDFDLDYNPETRILIVSYFLPSFDALPNIKEVKYVKSKDELVEIYLSQYALNKLYDSLVYQVSLRTIHELYEADVITAIDSIVFNGWVKSIDKATGQAVIACILSV